MNFLSSPGHSDFPLRNEKTTLLLRARAVSSIPEHWNLHFRKTVYQGVRLWKEMCLRVSWEIVRPHRKERTGHRDLPLASASGRPIPIEHQLDTKVCVHKSQGCEGMIEKKCPELPPSVTQLGRLSVFYPLCPCLPSPGLFSSFNRAGIGNP